MRLGLAQDEPLPALRAGSVLAGGAKVVAVNLVRGLRDERPDWDFVILTARATHEELATLDVAQPTARDVFNAVSNIRRRKLPDPTVIGNAGSFFKNPIVATDVAQRLLADHPSAPSFEAGKGLRKLSAAWLIDQCGLKGYRDGDAGVSPQHALVLVNHVCLL